MSLNLFLDTEVIYSNNFDFVNSRVFKSLRKCVDHDLVKLYVTDITYNEVLNRIEKNCRSAHEVLKSVNKDVRILTNIEEFYSISRKESCDTHIENIQQIFYNFIADTGLEVVSYDKVDIKRITEPYFQEKPPFNKSLKKNEFPDSISLLIIEQWILENDKDTEVASGDGDFKDLIETLSIERLTHYDSLNKVLDRLRPNLQLKEFLSENNELIIEKIKCHFDSVIINTDHYDEEIQSQNLYNVYIEDISIVDFDEDNDIFYVSIKTQLDFSFEIMYPDPDGYFYDSETKTSIYVGENKYGEYDWAEIIDIEFECEKMDKEGLEWDISPSEYSIYAQTDNPYFN